MALGTRTKMKLAILIRSTIPAIHKFQDKILESSPNHLQIATDISKYKSPEPNESFWIWFPYTPFPSAQLTVGVGFSKGLSSNKRHAIIGKIMIQLARIKNTSLSIHRWVLQSFPWMSSRNVCTVYTACVYIASAIHIYLYLHILQYGNLSVSLSHVQNMSWCRTALIPVHQQWS